MPGPLSLTSISAVSPSRATDTRMGRPAAYLIEFEIRFINTCSNPEPVPPPLDRSRDLQRQLALGGGGRLAHAVDHLPRRIAQVERLDVQPQLPAGDARHVEQGIDQLAHPGADPGRSIEALGDLLVHAGDSVPQVAEQQQQGGQRRLELVGGDGQELVTQSNGFARLDQPQPFLLGLPALGQIAGHLDEPPEGPFRDDGGDDDVCPEAGAILPYAPAFVLDASLLAGRLEQRLRPALGGVFRRVEDREVLADDLFRQIPLYQLSARVPGGDVTGGIEEKDGVVLDAAHEQLEPPLVLGSAAAAVAHAMALCSELSARRTPRSCGRSKGLRRMGNLAEPLAVDAVSGGDDGDRNRRQRRIALALLEKAIAVHDRHHQVEQDDRRSDLHAADGGQRLQAVARGPDLEAGLGQGFGQNFPDVDVVVDDEHRL